MMVRRWIYQISIHTHAHSPTDSQTQHNSVSTMMMIGYCIIIEFVLRVIRLNCRDRKYQCVHFCTNIITVQCAAINLMLGSSMHSLRTKKGKLNALCGAATVYSFTVHFEIIDGSFYNIEIWIQRDKYQHEMARRQTSTYITLLSI